MGGKGRTKAANTYSEEDDFNNFEPDGVDESDNSSDGDSEEQSGGDEVDEAGMDDTGRLRLRAPISMDGEEYAGKKSSRKEALDEGGDAELDPDDAAELTERLRAAHGAGSSDEEEDENEENANLIGGQDDELDALSREYEKLREEEEKGLEILKSQEKDSQQKGQAVRNQKALWDRSLEVRIALQKLLGSANRLPRTQAKRSLCQENEQVKDAFAQLRDSAVTTLDYLLDLGTLLVEQNSAITQSFSSSPNGNGKRDALRDAEEECVSDSAWDKLDGLCSKIVPYRDNSLDRWQRKTQIYTGAVGKNRLRPSNQSVSQQVATTMRDSSRLISRTRLKRDAVSVLGEQREAEAEEEEEEEVKKENSIASAAVLDDVELLRSAANAVEEEEGDPETFDDSEFYQQLLREFLEQSDPSALGSMALLHGAARQHNKKRKQVDRRASKGRKLRYNVFEPLRNFMAPKPMVLPSIATQLFGNLFGQKSKPLKSTS